MKGLNPMKLAAVTMREFEEKLAQLKNEKDFEISKKLGNKLLGYIDGLITVVSTMECDENDDFTSAFGAVFAEWVRDVYSVLAGKAMDAKADADYITRLLELRDDANEEARALWDGEA